MTVYTHVFSAVLGIVVTTGVTTALIQSESITDSGAREEIQGEKDTERPGEKEGEEPSTERDEPIDNELFTPFFPFATLDLSIADGLGGQFIDDALEEKRGAFTVANLNDSDYDGKIDKDDDDVEKDPDLIKVTVHSLLRKVNKKTFVVKVSEHVRLWDSEDKGVLIKDREFPISDLPKEFYVEAINYSKTVRDQFFYRVL
ncbi:MAG: hypothetical protein P1V97_12000 [Planctomycetota bacterium]|nr:hypothetical protein [Planctomycetota bacterium]